MLPLLFSLLLIPHLVLIKLNGLSPLPGKKVKWTINFYDHVKKIFGWNFIIFGFVGFPAMQFPAQLYPGPYAGVEMTKPPWIFLVLYQFEDWFGIQSLLYLPLVIIIGLILIPYIDSKKDDCSAMRKIVVWSYIVIAAVFITFIINVAVTPPVHHLGM